MHTRLVEQILLQRDKWALITGNMRLATPESRPSLGCFARRRLSNLTRSTSTPTTLAISPATGGGRGLSHSGHKNAGGKWPYPGV